jgi:acetyl-CoA carboxylase biotin carboxyl carrier protein
MTIDEIKELIHVVHDTGIFELEVQRGENKVRIRSNSAPAQQDVILPPAIPVPVAMHSPQTAPLAMAAPSTTPPVNPPAAPAAPSPQEDDRNEIVTSPIVGTYYDAPGPGAPTFVKVGDRVELRQVLCIIESMKLMNEIEAEVAGTVVAKFVENGRPVEYGEALFAIRPL